MGGNDGLADRQPDPHSFVGISAAVRGWRVAVKQCVQPLRRNSGAVIRDVEPGQTVVNGDI